MRIDSITNANQAAGRRESRSRGLSFFGGAIFGSLNRSKQQIFDELPLGHTTSNILCHSRSTQPKVRPGFAWLIRSHRYTRLGYQPDPPSPYLNDSTCLVSKLIHYESLGHVVALLAN